jgi:hypothetical protein
MKEYTKTLPVRKDEETYFRVKDVTDQFNRCEEYWRPETERIIRNQRVFWGLNFGQWPAYVVEKMRQQGRRPPTFNIIGKKIESQIGSFISNGFDITYAPTIGDIDSLTLKAQDIYYSEKAIMDWETSEMIALRDMFNAVGYERMIISDMYSDFGNIAFEPLPPTHVFLDPSWKSVYTRDLERYFVWDMMKPSQIRRKYHKASDRLSELEDKEKSEGIDYGEFHSGIQQYNSVEEKWGDYHKVIEYHYVITQERWWEWDYKNDCPFPETGFKPGSKEDHEAKTNYVARMNLDPNSDIGPVKQKKRVKMVEAICPTLDAELQLTKGKDRVQTNNVNLYPIGNSYNGQFKGTTDDLYDVQISYNRGEMNIDDIQARSAKGAFILDEALAGGDARLKAEIEAHWNDAGARIWVAEGTTSDLGQHGGIIELKGVPPTPDMFNQSSRRLDLADWLSMVPAAMDSRTENAQESGKLFQSKFQVGLIGQKFAMKIYERHKKDKAQAVAIQMKITHAGYPKQFNKAGTKDNFWVNRRVKDVYGRTHILDDISALPDMKVTCVPSKSGINVRTELRSQYAEVLNVMKDPDDRLLRLILIGGILETENMPDDTKEEIRKALQILKTNAALTEAGKNMQLRTAIQQIPGSAPAPQQPTQQQITMGEESEAEKQIGTPQQEEGQPVTTQEGGENG